MPRGASRYDEAFLQRRLWTPLQEGNLILRLDASAPQTIIIDGSSNVSDWYDLSGRDNHFTQATSGNRPAWSPFGYNGKPAVYSSNKLLGNATIRITGSKVYVYMHCYISSSTSNNGRFICLTNSSSSSDWETTTGFNISKPAANQFRIEHASTPTTSQAFVYDAPGVACGFFDGAGRYTAENGLDGTSTSGERSLDIQYVSLMKRNIGAGENAIGYVNEVIIETGDYNPPRRRKIEGYLSWKWQGSNNNLVATHPFKSRPPLIGD